MDVSASVGDHSHSDDEAQQTFWGQVELRFSQQLHWQDLYATMQPHYAHVKTTIN
jgi:hypothetical protein